MRILYIVHQFFPESYTGTERFVLNTAKQMQRMGHHVEVLTYSRENNNNFLFQDGAMYKSYEFQGVSVIAVKHKKVPEHIGFNIFDSEISPLLKEIITKENYDVVHIAHPMRLGSAIKIAALAGLPVVLTLTDFWLMCPRGIAVTSKGELCLNFEKGVKCIENCYGKSFRNKIELRRSEFEELIGSANCVVAATVFLRQIFLINYPDLKIDMIRFGEDYANVKPNMKNYSKDSTITLGFLSTLQPHKGAHVLLEAFKKANMNNLEVKIFGHYFSEINYYKELVDKYNFENVEFCGEYKYEDMSQILNDVDLIVVPSIWWENSPLVLLSALAHNVPAIVSNLGGLTEIVKDGENGFIFDAGDAESLAEVLKKICRDPTVLNDMKKMLHHPPRIEEQAFDYEKIYIRLVNKA